MKHVSSQTADTVPRSKCRGLLALDGTALTPEVLTAAEAHCLQMADRVDILLVNSPEAPPSVLHRLLIRLEQAGIDYRLTSSRGELGDQVSHYLRRFLGISLVIVTTLPALGSDWATKVANLRHQGYRLSALNGLVPA